MTPESRDETATRVLLAWLERKPPAGPVLLAGEGTGPVARALAAQGIPLVHWVRRLDPGLPEVEGPGDLVPSWAGGTTGPLVVGSWPPEGRFASAIYRLPKSKDELEMTARALVSRLEDGGELLVYGAKDEGIVSAPRRLEQVPGIGEEGAGVQAVMIKARCRVLRGVVRSPRSGLRGEMGEWRAVRSLPPLSDRWVTYPGLFAAGGLDPGTALLLDHLPTIPSEASVLDFGCGTGVIGAAVLRRFPGVDLDLVDHDALALEAARENVPGARQVILASGAGAITAQGPWDWIVSNPPYHSGKSETLAVVQSLVENSPRLLTPSGTLLMVVQKRFPVGDLLRETFRRVESRAEDPTYRVWMAGGVRGGR